MTTGITSINSVAELVAMGETVTLYVKGRSMSPTFRDGKDLIAISPVGDFYLSVGDVVLFDRGDCLCVHRIIERNGDDLTIRGDGNSYKALEYASVNDVKGIILSGTFRNGKAFSVHDDEWHRNTEFVLKHAKALSHWHRLTGILRRYPLSITVSIVLLYLSFFNPGSLSVGINFGDKIIHFWMYFLCTMVFWTEWLHQHRLTKRNIFVGMLPCFIFPIILGGLIELGQEYLTEYRSGDIMDFAADVLGTAAAMALSFLVTCPLIHFVRKKRRQSAGLDKSVK